MTQPASIPEPLAPSDIERLARAIRFSLCAIVLGLSYLNVRGALYISSFEQVFDDMLGNRPLPGITTFAFKLRPLLIGLSIALPVTAIAALFLRRLSASIHLSGALVLAVFIQLFFTWHAMSLPFFSIISGMAAPSH